MPARLPRRLEFPPDRSHDPDCESNSSLRSSVENRATPNMVAFVDKEVYIGSWKRLRLRFCPVVVGRGVSLYILFARDMPWVRNWWVFGVRRGSKYIDLIEVRRKSGRLGVIKCLRACAMDAQEVKHFLCIRQYPPDCEYGQPPRSSSNNT
jgi:hypothetical protein